MPPAVGRGIATKRERVKEGGADSLSRQGDKVRTDATLPHGLVQYDGARAGSSGGLVHGRVVHCEILWSLYFQVGSDAPCSAPVLFN